MQGQKAVLKESLRVKPQENKIYENLSQGQGNYSQIQNSAYQ